MHRGPAITRRHAGRQGGHTAPIWRGGRQPLRSEACSENLHSAYTRKQKIQSPAQRWAKYLIYWVAGTGIGSYLPRIPLV